MGVLLGIKLWVEFFRVINITLMWVILRRLVWTRRSELHAGHMNSTLIGRFSQETNVFCEKRPISVESREPFWEVSLNGALKKSWISRQTAA